MAPSVVDGAPKPTEGTRRGRRSRAKKAAVAANRSANVYHENHYDGGASLLDNNRGGNNNGGGVNLNGDLNDKDLIAEPSDEAAWNTTALSEATNAVNNSGSSGKVRVNSLFPPLVTDMRRCLTASIG